MNEERVSQFKVSISTGRMWETIFFLDRVKFIIDILSNESITDRRENRRGLECRADGKVFTDREAVINRKNRMI